MMVQWWLVVLVAVLSGIAGGVLVAWLLRGWPAQHSASGQAAPMTVDIMRNGDLEGTYNQIDNTTLVACDFMPFYSSVQSELGSEVCQKPEFKPIPRSLAPYRIKSGDTAQCLFIRWKLYDGGLWQECQVPAGALVRFSGWVQTWCSQSDDPHADDGELYFQLGLDLDGGINPWAPEVLWSGWERGTRAYQELEISAIATGPWVTCFVRAANKWRVSHNDAYIDLLRLEVSGGGVAPGRYVDRAWLASAYDGLASGLRGIE